MQIIGQDVSCAVPIDGLSNVFLLWKGAWAVMIRTICIAVNIDGMELKVWNVDGEGTGWQYPCAST